MEGAFVREQDRPDLSQVGAFRNWIFDFRPLLLNSQTLDDMCTLFFDFLSGETPFQVGGLETAAIALVAGMLSKGRERGFDMNGFYVRKSRRKDGFQNNIEGNLTDENIVLVDDILNSGKSFMRQIAVLEEAGRSVYAVCVLLRYRDLSFYEELNKRGIKIFSIFTLEEFPLTGGLIATQLDATKKSAPFATDWKFASEKPNYMHVVPKSAPVLDDKLVYFGADNGVFWAIRQDTGEVAWKYVTFFGSGGKRIFSSPAIWNDLVYFGSYDGNVYALERATGKARWIFREADWIGSSPKVAEDLGVLFIGLEFGLWKKQGGIAALDLKTGKKKWSHTVETYVHSTPGYDSKLNIVVHGSTEGVVYAYNARTGKPLWKAETGAAVRASFAFDVKRKLVCFGSEDRFLHALDTATGKEVFSFETFEPIYSSPLIQEGVLYIGLLDKRVIAIDLDARRMLWEFWTMSRIFADPVIVGEHLYIGSNDGRLYELDTKTGKQTDFVQTTERIVNRIAYNPKSNAIFLPTHANEIYKLRRLENPTG
jgi:outer membrane protein assembly factor BamB/orotate phosphoribosyltransferase